MKRSTYRLPAEYLAFATALFLLIVVIGLTIYFGQVWLTLLMITFGIFVTLTVQKMSADQVKDSQTVTYETFPMLAAVNNELRQRLPVPEYRLVILLDAGSYYVSTEHVRGKPTIFIGEALAYELTMAEARFVIGRELGHIWLRHTRWYRLLGITQWSMGYGWLSVFVIGFTWWKRLTEYSADRVGYALCPDLETAVVGLIKSVGGKFIDEASFAEVLSQINAEDDSFWNKLARVMADMPFATRRITALRKFAATHPVKPVAIG